MSYWYNHLNNPNRDSLLKFHKPTSHELIICKQMKFRKYSVFQDWLQLYIYQKTLIESERCLYEIIRGDFPQKFYIDIDKVRPKNISDEDVDKEDTELITSCFKVIFKLMPQIKPCDIFVFNSHGDGKEKRSYHIVVDRWCFPSFQQNKEFFAEFIELIPNKFHKYIDHSLYKSVQQFRLYKSHKFESDRTKILDYRSTWSVNIDVTKIKDFDRLIFLYSLISFTEHCSFLPYKQPIVRDYFTKDFSSEEVDYAIKLMNEKLNNPPFSYESYSAPFIILRRNASSYCSVCNKIHDSQNPYMFITVSSEVIFDCRRHPDEKKLSLGYIVTDYETSKLITSNKDSCFISIKDSSEGTTSTENENVKENKTSSLKNIDLPVKINSPKTIISYNTLISMNNNLNQEIPSFSSLMNTISYKKKIDNLNNSLFDQKFK